MTDEFDALLESESVYSLFQPIVNGASPEPHGFEALARGPVGSTLHSPAALFAAAAAHARTIDLERLCLQSALRHFASLRLDGKLFVNVMPSTFLHWPTLAEWLKDQLCYFGINSQTLVLEMTEHGMQQDETLLAAALAPVRALGCEIAIDDLGTGVSGLKVWSAIRPEYVKVDRYFVTGIEDDPVRGEILRLVVETGRATCSHIVAEGIESQQQFAIVRDLGVDYLQGFFIGKPAREPRVEHAVAAAAVGSILGVADVECAEHLARDIPAVDASTRVADVLDRFRSEPTLTGLAVVQGARPIGLVRRDALLILYSKPLHAEIYARKPITSVMDSQPVQVDARARLEQVGRLVTGRAERHQHEDFIITRNGAYFGLGRSMDLLRQITTQQLQAARHSNPLTGLPGNREIQAELHRLVGRGQFFVACHLDLDYFKPFNDTYGYGRGDEVLLHVAQILSRRTQRRVDFVGHLGGDDFVFFMRSRDWRLRLKQLFQELQGSLPNFHSPEHRDAGTYKALTREGNSSRYPLLGASIGAVMINDRSFATIERVSEGLRQAKAAAKATGGNTCMLAGGERLVNLLTQQELPELPFGDTVVIRAALKRLATA